MSQIEYSEYHCPCGYPKNNDGTCAQETVHPSVDCPCHVA